MIFGSGFCNASIETEICWNRMQALLRVFCCISLLQQVAFLLLIGCKTSRQSSEEFVQHPASNVPGTPHIPTRQGNGQADPFTAPGHMQPLGSHRPPEKPGVDVLDRVPDPEQFFNRYVRDGRPVVFRGAAKSMAAFQLWTDEYLSKQYGHLVVEVEEGKKENRSKDLWHMRLAHFIRNYQKEDVYLVTDVPTEMSDEFGLLRCISCGGFTQQLVSAILWYSSGGTKSVLHFDSVDNINCIMDGTKEIFLVDKEEKANIDIDHPDGTFSGVDVEKVDVAKYPGLGQVPWYNVTLEKGDCLFIPYRWFHSVYSVGRNLAVNVWFVHQLRFNASDCHDDPSTLPEFVPLSSVKTRAHDLEHVRSEIAHEAFSNGGSLFITQLLAMNLLDSHQGGAAQLFQSLDEDGNGQLSLDEIYSDGFIEACESAGIHSMEADEEERTDEKAETVGKSQEQNTEEVDRIDTSRDWREEL